MQNEPKLPPFQPKNSDSEEKRTQNEPKSNPNLSRQSAATTDAKQPKSTYALYSQSVMDAVGGVPLLEAAARYYLHNERLQDLEDTQLLSLQHWQECLGASK